MVKCQIVALRVCAALVLLLGAPAAWSQSLDELLRPLGRSERQAVLNTNSVQRNIDSWRDVELLPAHPFSEDIRETLGDARPNVLSETIILVRRGITDSEYLELYNSLRRVSELSDIEYYNPEKEKWHPLFDFSYRVEDEESETPLPDPVVTRIPRSDQLLVRQGLPPFGDTVSRYSYRALDNAFLFSGVNVTRITYKGFPVVTPEEMISSFLLIRGSDYVLLYGVGGARVFNFLGLLSGVIDNSFESRTTGLFDWYSQTYLDPLRDGELVGSSAGPPAGDG
jgi:hypothetical protein